MFEKIKKIKEKRFFNLVFAIVINAVILTIAVICINAKYDMADNQIFSFFIVDGEYNIIFTNYFLCWFCGLIQSIIYPVNAFVVVYLFFSYCSFVTLTVVILDRFSFLKSFAIILLVNGLFCINHYLTISFTLAPALITSVGFICAMHYIKKEKILCKGSVVGGILIIFGSLYRFESFIMVSCVFIAFFVGLIIKKFIDNRNNISAFQTMGKCIKLSLPIILSVVLSFGIYFLSYQINTSTDELSYYNDYTNARSAVWDYEIPDYSQCMEEYDKINIDENDIEMLRNGYMDDKGGFTLEKLNQIKMIQNNNKPLNSLSSILPTFKNLLLNLYAHLLALDSIGIFYIVFALVTIFYLIYTRKRMVFIPVILWICALLFNFILLLIGRAPFRSLYPYLCPSIIILLYLVVPENKKVCNHKIRDNLKKNLNVLVCILLCVISIFSFFVINNKKEVLTYPDSTENIKSYIVNNKDKKYELSRSVSGDFSFDEEDSVFSVEKNKVFNNSIIFNCTYYNHPDYKKQSIDFGAANLYLNLLKKDVFFVDSINNPHVDIMCRYINKYYSSNKKVSYNKIDTVDGYVIYKFI